MDQESPDDQEPTDEPRIDWKSRLREAEDVYRKLGDYLLDGAENGRISKTCKREAIHLAVKFFEDNDAIRIGAPPEEQLPPSLNAPIFRQVNVILAATILKHHPELASELRQQFPSAWPSRFR